jgi:uncharacterized lipoprotein YddW (UPF0748 family)
VATVDNIDWPTKPGLSTAEQKRELLAILDKAADLRLNAVILQVRPMCDALYQSSLEPWSGYLTGKQGRAPEPYWDPLAFAVSEAHKRGLELHAWFNPFRARHPSAKGEASPNHVEMMHPAWVRRYGHSLWLDPGDLEAREHSLRVVLDVVQRYDVDGVHIDDYFYPYPVPDPDAPKGKNAALDFPDGPSWKVYRDAGGTLNRPDWRRQNVDRFIQELYKRVKTAKPWVKVGISPFGIYRPGSPASVVTKFDQFAELYADPKLWLEMGWCDYISPQLYWKIDSKQSYPDLLKWWLANNPKGRYVWPGSYTSLVRPENKDWPTKEIVDQIQISRSNPLGPGHVHFSAVALMEDEKGLGEALKAGPYAGLALPPPLTWVSGRKPSKPTLVFRAGELSWSSLRADGVRFWALYAHTAVGWALNRVLPGELREVDAGRLVGADQAALSAIDAYGQESERDVVDLR